MADAKISALPSGTTPLAGTEVLPIVQSGSTKKVAVSDLTAGRAVSAGSLALTTPLSATSGGTGLSALGTDVATWLGTPSSANLAAAVTDETGTGPLVFATNPVFRNTAGAAAAGFTNSVFQDVLVNYYTASGTVGNKITLQFASNGGATATNSLVSYGSSQGSGLNNAIQLGNTNGAVRVTTAGDVQATTGNFIVASGKGIDFSATGQAGGMTSELLSDYEEGTWTPSVEGSTGGSGTTYTNQIGKYTKCGRTVTCTFVVSWTASTMTGDLKILGLPFTVGNTDAGMFIADGTVSIANAIIGNANASSTFIYCYKAAGATGYFFGTFSYFV
jgi:hypothetical protein